MSKQGKAISGVKKPVKRKRSDDDSPEHIKSKKAVQSDNAVKSKKTQKTPMGNKSEVAKKNKKSQLKMKDPEKKKPSKILYGDAKKSKFSVKSLKSESEASKTSVNKDKKTEKEGSKIEEMTFKDRKKLRKQKENSNFELAGKLKSLWEELRKADIKPDRRSTCSDNLFNLVHGHASALMFAHDTSRVFQTLLKYGKPEHRAALLEELKDDLVDIMKSKYAKFFVRKLLKYGTKEQRDFMMSILQKQIASLVRHREAVSVVEYAYNNFANATQRAAMAGSFYGPAFIIFKEPGEKTLQKFVETHPERRVEVLNHMKQSLSPLVDKSVLQHSFVHRLFSDYLNCANEEQLSEMVETVHETAVHMLHTHDGANIAMMCLWHGTAKVRKIIIKSFKSYVVKICKEEFGHMVILALFDSVDDTKIVQKVILDELLASIDELVNDRYGRKVLLYLLMPRDPVYFHPDIVSVLRRGDGNTFSKKDAVLRQSELRSHVSPALVKYVSENCRALVADIDTQCLVMSTIKHSCHDPTAAMLALAHVAAEPFSAAPVEATDVFHHVVDHHNGHYMLKRLIVNDTDRIKSGHKVLFSEVLVNTVPGDQLRLWSSCNRGCFVLVSLLELDHPAVSQVVRSHLSSMWSALRKYRFKGAEVLLKKLNV